MNATKWFSILASVLALGATACDSDLPEIDSGTRADSGQRDAGSGGIDAGPAMVDAGGSDAGRTDAGVDGGTPDECTPAPTPDFLSCFAGSTSALLAAGGGTFIVHFMEVALPDDSRDSLGFDLDGMDSGMGSAAIDATCEEFAEDFSSSVDGVAGVDNAFSALAPTLEAFLPVGCTLTDVLTGGFAAGDDLLLIEVTGIDDLTTDSDVSVELFSATVTGGGAPTVDGSGLLAPDQRFDGTSLGTFSGTITDGRLRAAATGRLTGSGGFMTPRNFANAEIAFDLCDDGLATGVLAGASSVDDTVAATVAIMPGIEDTVRAIYETVADLNPSAADSALCDDFSVVYGFTAIPAILSAP